MGKCASKQPQQQQRHQLDTKHITNLYESRNCNLDDSISISEQNILIFIENEGQTESKNHSKRSSGPETKGTAMSFGFKKKLLPSNKGKKSTVATNKTKEKDVDSYAQNETLASNSNSSILKLDNACCVGDKNGNIESSEDGRSTPRLLPPKKESSGAPYRSTRFGFRKATNIVRPASTGLVQKVTNFDNNVANNNLNSNSVKPRSKSACSTRTTAVTTVGYDSHQKNQLLHHPLNDTTQKKNKNSPKIDNREPMNVVAASVARNAQEQFNNNNKDSQQFNKVFEIQTAPMFNDYNINKPPSGRRSYTVISTELHTNEIVRPTPQAATTIISKFTLHTSSLPKPQYAVPISVTPNYAMDTKNAKQAANKTKKGFQAQREKSADSGIGSIKSSNSNGTSIDSHQTSPRRSQRARPRNLEMVVSGHKFQVRELADDSLSENTVVPLPLPELPSAFNPNRQPISLSGLVRSENAHRSTVTDLVRNHTDSSSFVQKHVAVTSINGDNIDEEKAYRDNSISEKHIKNKLCSATYSISSKNSSIASSILGPNAGEVMANQDFSVSSSDSSRDIASDILNGNQQQNMNLQDDDDLSTMTITDNKLISSITMPMSLTSESIEEETHTNESRNGVNSSLMQNIKFAAITAAVSDVLLDDETSPSDSLVSSTASDEIGSTKKAKKKINDSIKEKDIDEISPIFEIASPISHGTPTHASNSFSLSDGDGGRDFLIDDEIADQPALCFGDNHASTTHLNSLTDTPTLMETASTRSSNQMKKTSTIAASHNNSCNNSYAPQVKPRQSLLSRTESLDTLSPCESICSDDLMMDFECNSSIDSIDRISRSNHSESGNGINAAVDDGQIWCEFEQKSGSGMFKDWSYLIRNNRTNNQDGFLTQLPAKPIRLLNRSRVQPGQPLSGSDSPRSFDSLGNRRPSSRPSSLGGRDTINCSPDENLFMLDKTLRNSMIQDVQYCKQQLLQLRSILQDSNSLNPFEMTNGKFFNAGGLSGGYDQLLASLDRDNNYSPSISDDPKHDMVDLRRQVVYLQSLLDDKDRTIRIQQNLISKLEAEIGRTQTGVDVSPTTDESTELVNSATQTDRVRPISMNYDGSTSCKSEDEDTASLHSVGTNASTSSISSSSAATHSTGRFSNTNNKQNIEKNQTNAVIKRSVTTVKTANIGNTFSNSFITSKSKTISSNGSSPQHQDVSVPTTPVFKRVPRVIRTSPTTQSKEENSVFKLGHYKSPSPAATTIPAANTNGKYINNILEAENKGNSLGEMKLDDERNLNGLRKSPIKSVKLLNNLNMLKSKAFAVPVKGEEDA